MWRILLEKADLEPVDFSCRLELPAGVGGDDVTFLGEVLFSGELRRTGRVYLVRGHVEAESRLRCVRCLKEFDFHIHEDLEVEFRSVELAPQEEETRLERDELDVHFYREPVLDLVELAAEQVELALPLKPLCHEACQGLCPQCGADLNLGRCACALPPEDGAWAPLAHFRPQKLS